MTPDAWLLFLPRLPSSPSSLRVHVWRRLRAAGALGLQYGVWVLPHTPEQADVLHVLLAEVTPQGGGGLIFVATARNPGLPGDIVERFQVERGQDYAEFRGRCRDFLAEIAKETGGRNFTFAELEEHERDLQKLVGWWQRIRARDFFGRTQQEAADRALTGCQRALETFARAVYVEAGLAPADEEGGQPSS